MMQHLAAQKTDIASSSQVGIGTTAQNNVGGRGQEFASVFDQNRHIEKNSQRTTRSQDTQDAYQKRQAESARQASEDRHNEADKAESAANAQAIDSAQKRTTAPSEHSQNKQDRKQNDAVAKESTESQPTEDTDWQADNAEQVEDVAAEEGQAQTTPIVETPEQEAQGQVASKPAEHFDWLTMLDKIYGQSRDAVIETDGTIPPPETDIPADVSQLSELQKALKSIVDSQSQTLEEISADATGKTGEAGQTETDTDATSGDGEADSLGEILNLIDTLKSQDSVSDEDLAKLDQLIDEFIDTKPELEGSSLKALSGKEWLQLDTKLVFNALQTPLKADPAATTLAEAATSTDALARQIADANPEQIQKVAEYVAQQILPKDATPELKESFVDKLKAGLEDLKAQLKQGNESATDVAQVVKDALSGVTDAASAIGVEQAKLQQVLSVASTHLDVASQLSDPKNMIADTGKVNQANTASAKDIHTAQLEASRQQHAAQMDRAVNMHKPEAPQHLAEKVQVMVNQKNMSAEIRLDPPDLGGMKIKLNMVGDAASVNFVVQTQHAREALEQATPRLKELLDEQGIELGQSSVQQEANQQGEAGEGQLAGGKGGSADGSKELEGEAIEQHTLNVVNGSVNGIDYFA